MMGRLVVGLPNLIGLLEADPEASPALRLLKMDDSALLLWLSLKKGRMLMRRQRLGERI